MQKRRFFYRSLILTIFTIDDAEEQEVKAQNIVDQINNKQNETVAE